MADYQQLAPDIFYVEDQEALDTLVREVFEPRYPAYAEYQRETRRLTKDPKYCGGSAVYLESRDPSDQVPCKITFDAVVTVLRIGEPAIRKHGATGSTYREPKLTLFVNCEEVTTWRARYSAALEQLNKKPVRREGKLLGLRTIVM